MQLFSITALIISFNEHHSPLFPSAWFSLCICLCNSSLNPLFPAHIISPFLSLSHTNSMAFTIPSLPISLYSPWFDAQLMPRFISALLKHPLGFHPTTHSLSHTHTHWTHMLRYCVIFCWFKLISGIIRRAHESCMCACCIMTFTQMSRERERKDDLNLFMNEFCDFIQPLPQSFLTCMFVSFSSQQETRLVLNQGF